MWRWKQFATNSTWLLAALFVLAVIGRIWFFNFSGPRSLNQDEAAILLNARLLAETGRDEWGASWPIAFRSFGDAKLPGYIYTVLLLGKLIGFSDLTVRLPSFLAGLAILWLVYHLALRLTSSRAIGLAAGLLAALSPWSWHYGTLGFEANLGLALWLGGLSLILFHRWKGAIAGAIAIGLSLLTYNAPLLLLPSALAAIILIDWGRWRLVFSKIGLVVGVGVLAGGLTLSATLQKQGISIFQDPTYLDAYPAYRALFEGELLRTFLGNKFVYFGSIAWSNWWTHLSWRFLVTSGGANPWHTIPHTGHLHFFLPILLAAGLAINLRSVWRHWRLKHGRGSLAILILFVWSLLPASITADAPHATRSLFFFVMSAIIAGQALVYLDQTVCDSRLPKRWRDGVTYTLAGFLIVGFTLWWWPSRQNWRQWVDPRWNRGLAEVLRDPRVDRAEKVYVLDPDGVLYTLVADTKNVDAQLFLATVRRSAPDTAGIVRVERFSRYEFIFQVSDARAPGVLLQPRSNQAWDIIEL